MTEYAKNKPKTCKACSYWQKIKKNCTLKDCFFLLKVPNKVPSPCITCPYGRGREFCFPCLKEILGQEGISAYKNK